MKKPKARVTHRIVRFTLIASRPSISCACGFIYRMEENAVSRTHGQNTLLDAYNLHIKAVEDLR